VIDVVLLKPLPYRSLTIPKFNAMAAHDFVGPCMNVGGSDHPEQINGVHVSFQFSRVFGVSPVLRRTFTAGEGMPSEPSVAVIGGRINYA
jgi:putative ABC transport system permease protein